MPRIRSLARSAALASLLPLAACAQPGDDRIEKSAAETSSSFDDPSLLTGQAVLTCEEAQSAGDPRSHWQLWLDPKPEGGFIYRRAQNQWDPWEGTITLEIETLAEFDDCRASAAEPRIITCFRPGSRFLVTSWVEETSIPIGGVELFTSSHFQVTWQQTGPADREELQFFYFDQECWASVDDRLGS